jgi:hypothetical protein
VLKYQPLVSLAGGVATPISTSLLKLALLLNGFAGIF